MIKITFPILVTFLLLTATIVGIGRTTIDIDNQSYDNIDQMNSCWKNTPPFPIRQPAEFEPMQGVLIRYPFGIPYSLIAEIAEAVELVTIVANSTEQNYVETLYISNGINLDNCSFLIAPSNRIWTRDYGPWFIFTGDNEFAVVDFKYSFLFRFSDNAIPGEYANDQNLSLFRMPLIHEGGNYMTDGQGIAISTNLVWAQNLFRRRSKIEQITYDYLGIQKYHIVLDANGYLNPVKKHIDCWAKFLAPDVIMIRKVPQYRIRLFIRMEAAVKYFEAKTSCYGTPYKIVRIYTPNDEPYINSLILNNKVFVPLTGGEWDDEAIETYEKAMPGYEVLGFRGFWKSVDAIHCRTKGIPDRYMLYIEHMPLLKNQSFSENGYEIQAKIVPYSGEKLIANSTLLYWKAEGSNWNYLQMEYREDNYYTATIPPQKIGTKVYYYIHAEDFSGRKENHPYIGAPWAHSFTIDSYYITP
ncbi:MAG: agmatine deiminase family protein [Thermoplasmatales archaeon]|nr:MAG: agmatine deiminase family protein [Thermoplasmatales archaeon]